MKRKELTVKGESLEPSTVEQPRPAELLRPEITVTPWIDPLVESHGFGPRSLYVEACWLPVLGPTATWLYRRLGSWVETNPEGVQVDLVDLSVSLGLGEGLGRNSLLGKSLRRLARFDVARWMGEEMGVRRALAPLPERHAHRLSASAYELHRQHLARRDAANAHA